MKGIAVHLGHEQIGENHVGALLLKQFNRFRPRRGAYDLIILDENVRRHLEHHLLVVNDEYLLHDIASNHLPMPSRIAA